jgi:hypothetical protein
MTLLWALALAGSDGDDLFEKRIRPVLVQECFSCHGAKEAKNGLRVDSRGALLKGGESGPAVVPADPEKSLLIRAIRGTDPALRMPPKKRLPREVVDDFVRWVQAGAPWPSLTAFADVHAGKNHWAFQPLKNHAPPATASPARTPVDAFLLASLKKNGREPAAPADKRTLLRRATYGLIGLPPTPEEIRDFLADSSPDAFRAVVDRLLASPHYGERWGRHWLDVVRYADTAGNAPDFPVPQAYLYRNYVVRAFNEDKPYDEFLREQIAGDLLSPRQRTEAQALARALASDAPAARAAALRALTALDGDAAVAVPALEKALAHPDSHVRQAAATALVHIDLRAEERWPAVAELLKQKAGAGGRYQTLLRRIRVPDDVTAHSFFNDHGWRYGPTGELPEYKGHTDLPEGYWVYVYPDWYVWRDRTKEADERRFDPLVATGYLAIHRRFGGTDGTPDPLEVEDIVDTLGRSVLGLSLSCARCHDHKFDPVSHSDYYALYGIFGSTRYPFPGAEGSEAQKHFVPLEGGRDAYAVSEGTPADARIQIGGDPNKPGGAARRGFPGIVGGQHLPPGAPGSGRLHLAEWLTDPATNPLTARVMVNRIWQHHFGRGLVATPNDFGVRGAPPTHPELLDTLAVQFVESGWSVKEMHRRILLSDAYRRASGDSPDPLLGRFPRRRLDAEAIRDSLLAISGELDRAPGTAHPFPPAGTKFSQHAPFNAVYETPRRSVYLMQQRLKRHPFLALFDGPDPNASTGSRLPTTSPLQALFWMNDPFFHGRADAAAKRFLAAAEGEAERLGLAFETVLGRPPRPEESRRCREHLNASRADLGEPGAWASLVRVLLSSNEFLYVD